MNFDRKESRDAVDAQRLFSPCMAAATRAQKCLWGIFRVAFVVNERLTLDTRWRVVRKDGRKA